VVWPWYETWGFVFLAVVAEGWTLPLVLVLSSVACFANVPRPGLLIAANPILVSISWACFVGVIVLFLVTRVVSCFSRGTLPEQDARQLMKA
jgi:hypothetical protein